VSQEAFVEIVGNDVTVADFALVDAAGPAITGVTTLIAAAASDGPHPITAEIADASGVASAQLFYRSDGGAWTVVSMSPARGVYSGLLPAAAANTRLDYYIRATDEVGLVSASPADAPAAAHTLWVCETVFADNAEDPGLPGWQFGVAGDGATAGIWVRGDPTGTFDGDLPIQPEDDHTAAPGVACFLTGNCQPGDPPYTNDVSGGCTTLVSPVFDLAGADLAFFEHHRWFAKAGNAFDDELALDVSNDGGATWAALDRIDGSRPAWTRAVPELGAVVPLTGQMRVRLVACDLNDPGIVEAALDDVRLLAFRGVLTTTPEPVAAAASFALQPAQPNPFNPATRLTFELPAASSASLRVYDLSGRLVRTLVDETTLAAGRHQTTWDGQDDAGRAVAAGIYIGRLEAAGRQAAQRLVLVK
jgi:hypothetical protein